MLGARGRCCKDVVKALDLSVETGGVNPEAVVVVWVVDEQLQTIRGTLRRLLRRKLTNKYRSLRLVLALGCQVRFGL